MRHTDDFGQDLQQTDEMRDLRRLGVDTMPYRHRDLVLKEDWIIAVRYFSQGVLRFNDADWSDKKLNLVLQLDIPDAVARGWLIDRLFAPDFYQHTEDTDFADLHGQHGRADSGNLADIIVLPSRIRGRSPLHFAATQRGVGEVASLTARRETPDIFLTPEALDDFMVARFRFCLFELSQLMENQLWVLEPENHALQIPSAIQTRLDFIGGLAELNEIFDYTEYLEPALRAFMRLFLNVSNDEALLRMRQRERVATALEAN